MLSETLYTEYFCQRSVSLFKSHLVSLRVDKGSGMERWTGMTFQDIIVHS